MVKPARLVDEETLRHLEFSIAAVMLGQENAHCLSVGYPGSGKVIHLVAMDQEAFDAASKALDAAFKVKSHGKGPPK